WARPSRRDPLHHLGVRTPQSIGQLPTCSGVAVKRRRYVAGPPERFHGARDQRGVKLLKHTEMTAYPERHAHKYAATRFKHAPQLAHREREGLRAVFTMSVAAGEPGVVAPDVFERRNACCHVIVVVPRGDIAQVVENVGDTTLPKASALGGKGHDMDHLAPEGRLIEDQLVVQCRPGIEEHLSTLTEMRQEPRVLDAALVDRDTVT